MRLLDLFCGAGGASVGYHRLGMEVVGVDVMPQPNYPFAFINDDATTYPLDGFDIIHASPPCQPFSTLRGYDRESAWFLLPSTIQRLRDSSARLWVVENVMSAYPEPHAFRLCGGAMGCVDHNTRRYLVRHRKFWSNLMATPPDCTCRIFRRAGWATAGVYGGGSTQSPASKRANQVPIALARSIMGIDWMARHELAEAIPPAYTSWIMDEAVRQRMFD